jgi:hypothetical protein
MPGLRSAFTTTEPIPAPDLRDLGNRPFRALPERPFLGPDRTDRAGPRLATTVTMHRPPVRFTLIELAILLVVIGLLLGGMLKGQELVEHDRVDDMVTQLKTIQSAYHNFQERYGGVPGDYPGARAYKELPGIANASVGGNGDGVVRDTPAARETLLLWVHLSHAKLIPGDYQTTTSLPDPKGKWPCNPYHAMLQLQSDADYADSDGVPHLNLKTGNQVPARVLAEIDRKIDDGRATTGKFRFSGFNGGGGAPVDSRCYDPHTGRWKENGDEANCGAALLF